MAKNGFRQGQTQLQVAPDWTVGIVTSRFNEDITSELQRGALEMLEVSGIEKSQVVVCDVAGAIEIPVVCKALFLEKKVDAVIALGCVIRGETTHYESVCNSVERGCTQVALEFTKPVISGVLTVENHQQALDRIGGSHGHKGKEAALTALEMIQLLRKLKNHGS
ncbi:MAG TPA: 6,7-dimethyl-8-ribityllumazine synthase [Bdellovibrionales bacterium]|nr:6,7-dimethyl-8-ribityllumazine synthase [Pseudobdellovibrionaceae bacterium]HAG92018.1 6,7-dimethyl-8-ribityllumazine synthase [Bdellovibrionales bacterium]|tara:strand:+ start:1696 stop:2190 length:495 start_codon:yes stop_codon:yes gene_type:complete